MSRIIHTDTFSPKSHAILAALKTYMHDNWGSSQMSRNASLATLDSAPNGENTWNIDDGTYSYHRSTYSSRNDNSVREWLACSLKHIIYAEFRRSGLAETKEWKRKNKRVVRCLSNAEDVTVAEAYCLFDKLLNRKTFAKRWTKKMIDLIVGKEKDPIAAELEAARREEVKKLEEKFRADKQKLENEKYAEIDRVSSEVRAIYAKKQVELEDAYKQSCKELEDAMKFTADFNLIAGEVA